MYILYVSILCFSMRCVACIDPIYAIPCSMYNMTYVSLGKLYNNKKLSNLVCFCAPVQMRKNEKMGRLQTEFDAARTMYNMLIDACVYTVWCMTRPCITTPRPKLCFVIFYLRGPKPNFRSRSHNICLKHTSSYSTVYV